MSSKLRYIISYGGGFYAGSEAKLRLALSTGMTVKTKNQVIGAAKALGAQLWIFREPHNAAKKRSRYKLLCNYLGIRSRAKKQGAKNAENNGPRQAPPRAPRAAVRAVVFNPPAIAINEPF